MPARTWITACLAALGLLLTPLAARAQEEFRHGTSLMGEPKHEAGFERFDYVNPDAPKGGTLRLSQSGTFDTFNPVLAKGETAAGLNLVFETLLKSSEDEVSTSYGLLAEGVSYPEDISQATFRVRKEAKWADGQPVTPEDVIFSFEMAKEHNPQQAQYYAHVVSAEKTGERDVTFKFDQANNRELPQILGQFSVIPRHWWEAEGPNGKPRDIAATTLEPVMGSGPYEIASHTTGSAIRYQRREDYWGKDLNVNVGQYNFDTIIHSYFADRNVEFESFRAGNIDWWFENQASRWATGYDFPAAQQGKIEREEIPNLYRSSGIMQAMVPNMRREMFKDPRVRRALNYALDFEELNRTVFYGQYERCDSYFFGTELASSGLPDGRELEILNEVKDQVPPAVFTEPYANPVGGTAEKTRENLRKAVELMREAGWEIRGGRMTNVETGKPFSFEILLSSPTLERVALPFAQSLQRIGIDARVRTVDASQYTNRTRSFDYDMTWVVWGQSLTPGNEQHSYWGSQSAEQPGTRNYAGIADPAIDKLISKVIFADSREELVAATRALDRVLLHHHFVVPLYYRMAAPVAYWNTIARPEQLPEYGIGFPHAWWSTRTDD